MLFASMSGFKFSTQVVLIFSCPQEDAEMVPKQKVEIMWPLSQVTSYNRCEVFIFMLPR
jgi:hypothetical protein